MFRSNGTTNPIDAHTPLPFKRYNGQQDIIITDTSTGQFILVEVDYGVISDGGGYKGVISPTANCTILSTIGCTAVGTSTTAALEHTTTVTVTDPVTTRVYELFLDPWVTGKTDSAPPTIRLVSGPLFATTNMEVLVQYRRFTYV
jgi:hypothetical protein